MVWRASSSDDTFIDAISAAIAEPLRPETIMAVISGPIWLIMAITVRSTIYISAPKCLSSLAECSARTSPIAKDITIIIKAAFTPIRTD